MTTITQLDAQKTIADAVQAAIAGLPYEHDGRVEYATHVINGFRSGRVDTLYLEFGISFHVTATLSVTRVIGTPSPTYGVTVSQSSGMRTLSQQQASHDLMGDVLKAAHRVQAVIDGLPTIDKKS